MAIVVTMAIMAAAALTFFAWPICTPLSNTELQQFNVPIEERDQERGGLYRTWQFKDGQWNQCKSRAEKFLFS